MKKTYLFLVLILLSIFFSCNKKQKNTDYQIINKYIQVPLKTDISFISDEQKNMLKIFFRIIDYTDSIYFYESFGNYKKVLDTLTDSVKRKLFILNFGPWDRFTDQPFIDGFGQRPEGGNFYPYDITAEEFIKFSAPGKYSHYTFIRRDNNGKLVVVPYYQELKKYIDTISALLIEASELTHNNLLAEYLRQRAKDLKNDNYYKSDSLWVVMNNDIINFVVGPMYIATDKFMDLKADHIALLLIKDSIWSQKVKKYNVWLKYLQNALPVPEKYKSQKPGDASSIEVYNAIGMGGSAKISGVFLSAVMPQLDENIALNIGVKNLQFKNIIEYKSDYIIKPIAAEILEPSDLKYITSEAFFVNTILWEIGNSLGIKNTVNGKGSVRKALKETYTIIEYLKNNLMSLYLVNRFAEVDEIQNDLNENYYTFVVDLIRALRFGASNQYAKANLITLNYLLKQKAIKLNWNKKIKINYQKFRTVTDSLLSRIIIMQGEGDYEQAKKFIKKNNVMPSDLYTLLQNLSKKQIPVDIYPVQGIDILLNEKN